MSIIVNGVNDYVSALVSQPNSHYLYTTFDNVEEYSDLLDAIRAAYSHLKSLGVAWEQFYSAVLVAWKQQSGVRFLVNPHGGLHIVPR